MGPSLSNCVIPSQSSSLSGWGLVSFIQQPLIRSLQNGGGGWGSRVHTAQPLLSQTRKLNSGRLRTCGPLTSHNHQHSSAKWWAGNRFSQRLFPVIKLIIKPWIYILLVLNKKKIYYIQFGCMHFWDSEIVTVKLCHHSFLDFDAYELWSQWRESFIKPSKAKPFFCTFNLHDFWRSCFYRS